MSEYDRYLKSWRWRMVIRPIRLWLDGYRCVACHARRRLQVHHASYKNRGDWAIWEEIADCITLCDACHEGVHRMQPIQEFSD